MYSKAAEGGEREKEAPNCPIKMRARIANNDKEKITMKISLRTEHWIYAVRYLNLTTNKPMEKCMRSFS